MLVARPLGRELQETGTSFGAHRALISSSLSQLPLHDLKQITGLPLGSVSILTLVGLYQIRKKKKIRVKKLKNNIYIQ